MTTVNLSDHEMEGFRNSWRNDAAMAKLNELERAHVQHLGGVTLAIWRLHRGIIFDEPIMMSIEDIAARLRLPLSTVEQTVAAVHESVRAQWHRTTEYTTSNYAKR